MKLFVGIDVSSKKLDVCFLDSEDTRLTEKTLPNDINGANTIKENILYGIVEKDDISFYTDVIIEETNNLNFLVIDMLNLAKLENDPYSIKEEKVNLLEFLRTIIRKYYLMMQNHDFITDVDVDSSPYSIFDSMRIEEVLIK